MAVRTRRVWSVCLAAALAAAAGCSSSDDDDTSDTGDGADDGSSSDDGTDDGTADDGATDDGGDGTYRVDWGPVTVPAGRESTMCVRKRLPTDRSIRIGQIVNDLGQTSHHMIVYRLSGDGQTETDEPEECVPFVDVLDPAKGAPLAVTQRSKETISLPPGVAFTLEPNQMIRIELHFVNASDTETELSASSTFVVLPEEEFEQEADFLFVGNPDISVGAGEEAELVTPFLPLPAVLADINIFAVTGHEHQWGTGVTASIVTSATDQEERPIYEPETFQWSEPETIYHDPPIAMPGGRGFRFTCTWRNLGTEDVGFGESVDDEMCFFWAYYYPSRGAKICFHTQFNGGTDICCPSDDAGENAICQLIDDFLGRN